MEILFAVLVLVLIIAGLRSRKKEKKEWLTEERYEESGDWLDKRSGERGTYGALDKEMEANRQYISLQGKISELALLIQKTCFSLHPAYHSLSNEQIKKHLSFCKSSISALFEQKDAIAQNRPVNIPPSTFPVTELQSTLEKQVMAYAFDAFPSLLDLEIEQIKRFESAVKMHCQQILGEIERF